MSKNIFKLFGCLTVFSLYYSPTPTEIQVSGLAGSIVNFPLPEPGPATVEEFENMIREKLGQVPEFAEFPSKLIKFPQLSLPEADKEFFKVAVLKSSEPYFVVSGLDRQTSGGIPIFVFIKYSKGGEFSIRGKGRYSNNRFKVGDELLVSELSGFELYYGDMDEPFIYSMTGTEADFGEIDKFIQENPEVLSFQDG